MSSSSDLGLLLLSPGVTPPLNCPADSEPNEHLRFACILLLSLLLSAYSNKTSFCGHRLGKSLCVGGHGDVQRLEQETEAKHRCRELGEFFLLAPHLQVLCDDILSSTSLWGYLYNETAVEVGHNTSTDTDFNG